MDNSKKPQWNFARFLQTLSFFEVLPFQEQLNGLQEKLGWRSPVKTSFKQSKTDIPDAAERLLFDFRLPSDQIELWGSLDDVVMGGASESGMQLGDGVAIFRGNVTTANSGGFASVRTRNLTPIDLENYQGIELSLRGDGNRYKFMMRDAIAWDGVAYCHSFDTIADLWMDIRIPFSELVPVFRARTIKPPTKLNVKHICAFQLMLSKFEYDGMLNPTFHPGPFQLQVSRIGAYSASR